MDNQTKTLIMVDVSGSLALKVRRGEADAGALIARRLSDIEAAFRAVDPTIERPGPSEGDSLFLVGTATVLLFQAAVLLQASWKSWSWSTGVPATRIALGAGEFTSTPDGKFIAQRGISIDLTKRVLDACPFAGVAVTESVRSVVQAAGFAYKLIRAQAHMKGFEEEQNYYLADGIWTQGEEAKSENFDASVPIPIITIMTPSLPIPVFWNGPRMFWKIFALAALGVAAALVALRVGLP